MTRISRRHALTLLTAAAGSALLPSFTFASDKTIICNWDKTFPPYSMERDGKMTGILVDCMDDILGKRMGYTVEHRGMAWPQAQTLVQEGKADVLCTNPTDTRKQYMYFSEEPVVESLPSIFCAVDNPRISQINGITSMPQLSDFSQVDYEGNGWAAKTFPPYLKIRYVKDMAEVFTLISRHEADIFVGNGLAAMYAIKQAGLKNKIHARELAIGEPSSFHFGIRQDFPDAKELISTFEGALDEAMIDNATRKIIMHYL
ncbi:transporter substrate-binding domain-containing protein [Pseudodesulfovibrio sp. zrk46]|uniref:transporter substrate-binding domain-containing protein n=1 Tax=Pseudodesulfovibrio sp. zrk46 TaxID=2725288 RepID=UPI0014499FD8|nr:transporter substrate-binding domain-containing protein [Pseudodesulfovibrio sp. zrk46]QJB57011.1 transporter substrate-binding domain-containing protein [Pseudodesulfovibrio sp. zrk46]